jgi:CubicO group peptidase (beta-lactamase class C family)
VSANAGSYVMPSREDRFPSASTGSPAGDAEMKASSRATSRCCSARTTTTRTTTSCPTSPGEEAGPHRFARGQRYLEVARREAARLGVPLAWKIATAPGVAHSAKGWRPSRAHLFETWPATIGTRCLARRSRLVAGGLDAARRKAEEIGSAAVMIVQDGEVVAQWGDVGARYKCHSIRKSLLSALVGLHVESGAIDLGKTMDELGIDDREGLCPAREGSQGARPPDGALGRVPPDGLRDRIHEEPQARAPQARARDVVVLQQLGLQPRSARSSKRATGRGIFDEFRDRIAAPTGMQDFRYDKRAARRRVRRVRHLGTSRLSVSFVDARPRALRAPLPARRALARCPGHPGEVGADERASVFARGERGAYGYMWWVARGDIHFPQMSCPRGRIPRAGAGGHYCGGDSVARPGRRAPRRHRRARSEGREPRLRLAAGDDSCRKAESLLNPMAGGSGIIAIWNPTSRRSNPWCASS